MKRRAMFRALLGPMLVGAVLTHPAAAQEVSGLTFDVRITTGDSAAGTHQTGRGWISGKRTRLDLAGGVPNPVTDMGGGNVSIIMYDSSDTPEVTLLMHDTKKIMQPSKMMAQMKEMMAGMAGQPKMRFSVSNLVVDSLGAGETVSGFTTKRFRLRADISISVEMMGENMSQSMHLESEGDYAEGLADFADPLRDARGFRALTSGMPWMDSSATAEMEKLMRATPRGLALRHVDRITGDTEGGIPTGTTVTTLSNIKRATFAASVFAIPEGYTEMEMPPTPELN